jgi:hypothetical protein
MEHYAKNHIPKHTYIFNHIYTLGKLVITNNTYQYALYTYFELKEHIFLEDRTQFHSATYLQQKT